MNDIWITCDVIIDPVEDMVYSGFFGAAFLISIPVIGIAIFAIVKLVMLIKSNSNKSNSNTDSIEGEQSVPAEQSAPAEQSVPAEQKDDIE